MKIKKALYYIGEFLACIGIFVMVYLFTWAAFVLTGGAP